MTDDKDRFEAALRQAWEALDHVGHPDHEGPYTPHNASDKPDHRVDAATPVPPAKAAPEPQWWTSRQPDWWAVLLTLVVGVWAVWGR